MNVGFYIYLRAAKKHYTQMTEEVFEYELLDIEWLMNYEFDLESTPTMVRDDTLIDQNAKEESKVEIVYDTDGIPMGQSVQETAQRRQIVKEFIQQWRANHPDPRIWNEELHDYIKINQVFLIEAVGHSAIRYASTKAIFQMETIMTEAKMEAKTMVKTGDKNQKPFQYMLVMSYQIEGLGRAKLTVGVRLRTHEKVAYDITVPSKDVAFVDPKLEIKPKGKKKKAPRK